MWMVYSLVVRARGLEYGGREFESRSLHLKPETKLREERGSCKGQNYYLKLSLTVPLTHAISVKIETTTTTTSLLCANSTQSSAK